LLNSGSSAIGEIRRNDREDGARLAAAVHRPGRGRQHSVPAAVFARLTAYGDMHLKNLTVLKTAEAGAKTFTTVRFAPLYDAVTTRVFPGLGGDRMALKLNGTDDRLTRQDFLALARTIGLTAEDATAGLEALTTRIPERLMALQLPALPVSSAAPGFGIVTRRTGMGRDVPASSWSRMTGHAVRSCAAVWSMSSPSTRGRALVGSRPLPGLKQVLSRQHRHQQPRPRVPRFVTRTACFAAVRTARGFGPPR